VVDVSFVVGDRDALAFALEEAGLANDAFRAVDGQRLLPAELELRGDAGVVDDLRELVPGLELEDIDRANIPAMGASRALLENDVDLNHLG
jgi:hypothetical protein